MQIVWFWGAWLCYHLCSSKHWKTEFPAQCGPKFQRGTAATPGNQDFFSAFHCRYCNVSLHMTSVCCGFPVRRVCFWFAGFLRLDTVTLLIPHHDADLGLTRRRPACNLTILSDIYWRSRSHYGAAVSHPPWRRWNVSRVFSLFKDIQSKKKQTKLTLDQHILHLMYFSSWKWRSYKCAVMKEINCPGRWCPTEFQKADMMKAKACSACGTTDPVLH